MYIPIMVLRLTLILFLSFLGNAFAQDALEKKAQSIDKKLIAPCCWTSTLDQHFSPEAEDMKAEVRERLSRGESEKEILTHFESKFGERILSEPKTTGFNLAVWIFPGLALLAGLGFVIRFLYQQPSQKPFEDSVVKKSAEDEKYRKQIDRELYRNS